MEKSKPEERWASSGTTEEKLHGLAFLVAAFIQVLSSNQSELASLNKNMLSQGARLPKANWSKQTQGASHMRVSEAP